LQVEVSLIHERSIRRGHLTINAICQTLKETEIVKIISTFCEYIHHPVVTNDERGEASFLC